VFCCDAPVGVDGGAKVPVPNPVDGAAAENPKAGAAVPGAVVVGAAPLKPLNPTPVPVAGPAAAPKLNAIVSIELVRGVVMYR
jgi:hypothetical protein